MEGASDVGASMPVGHASPCLNIIPHFVTPPLERVVMASESGTLWCFLVNSGYGLLGGKGWSPNKNYQNYAADAHHRDNIASVEENSARVQLWRFNAPCWGPISKICFAHLGDIPL